MATLNVPQGGKAARGSSRKPIPGVDLTAMVDLAFLLITFFMLTTSLGKMGAMEIAKPDDPGDETTVLQPWPASRTMTILLGKNDQSVCFLGEANQSSMQVVGVAELKKAILAHKKKVAASHSTDGDQSMYVIIKPTSTSVYKNFVDAIDEVRVNNVDTYAIDDKYLLDEEIRFMKSKGI